MNARSLYGEMVSNESSQSRTTIDSTVPYRPILMVSHPLSCGHRKWAKADEGKRRRAARRIFFLAQGRNVRQDPRNEVLVKSM